MEKQPAVSVIVPVYKAENYLHRCVDSLLAQTFTDFEILLIDDGSPDHSGIICDEYAAKDSRIRVFHKENGGVSSARNIGLDKSNGEWIVFVDSDDWVDDIWLEKYNDSMDIDTDIIFQGYVREERNNKQIFHYYDTCKKQETVNIIPKLEQRDLFGWTWMKIFRSSIIKKYNLRFNQNISMNEDLIFTLEFCLHIKHKIKVLSSTTYHYNDTPNSLFYKQTPYEEAKIKIEQIYALRIDLYNKFSLEESYRKWIELSKMNQMIDALVSLYCGVYKYPLSSLYPILRDIRTLSNDFVPDGKLGKIIVMILQLFKNDYLANLFLKMVISCWKLLKGTCRIFL